MPEQFNIEIHGADALNARLRNISEDMRKKGGRFALRRAANLIQKKVKEAAERLDDPDTANSIPKNVIVRWDKRYYRSTGDLKFRVGIRGGAKSRQENQANPGGDTWYWRLVEFGTEHSQAHPFMRPALSQNADAAIAEFVAQYNKKLDRMLAQP